MSEEQVVLHCAPTLKGIKPGNLFSAPIQSEAEMNLQVRILNRLLGPKGVRVVPMQHSANRALIYVYRPSQLEKYFHSEDVAKLLKRFGYSSESTGNCVAQLRRRMKTPFHGRDSFPHEVGLFLGYPAEDVNGFIEHRAKGFKMVGTWKVYGDSDAAERRFRAFKQCTNYCVSRYEQGVPIDQIAAI